MDEFVFPDVNTLNTMNHSEELHGEKLGKGQSLLLSYFQMYLLRTVQGHFLLLCKNFLDLC